MADDFKKKVLKIVAGIGKGETMTYKEVSQLAGGPKAWRVVGNILNKNFNPVIPCYRVIRSDGKAGGYNRGAKLKQKLLLAEAQSLKRKQG